MGLGHLPLIVSNALQTVTAQAKEFGLAPGTCLVLLQPGTEFPLIAIEFAFQKKTVIDAAERPLTIAANAHHLSSSFFFLLSGSWHGLAGLYSPYIVVSVSVFKEWPTLHMFEPQYMSYRHACSRSATPPWQLASNKLTGTMIMPSPGVVVAIRPPGPDHVGQPEQEENSHADQKYFFHMFDV